MPAHDYKRLLRSRYHARELLDALPESYGGCRAIVEAWIETFDRNLGVEKEAAARDFDSEIDDAEMPYGAVDGWHEKADGQPTEREMAHHDWEC